MRLVFCAGYDPPSQRFLLPDRELFMRLAWWHHFLFVLACDAPPEFGFRQLTRQDRPDPIAFRRGSLESIQPQPGFPFRRVRAVTGKTVVRENRANIPVESHLFAIDAAQPQDEKVKIQRVMGNGNPILPNQDQSPNEVSPRKQGNVASI